eukprot:97704-Pyramimonas_sp.AAC.1
MEKSARPSASLTGHRKYEFSFGITCRLFWSGQCRTHGCAPNARPSDSHDMNHRSYDPIGHGRGPTSVLRPTWRFLAVDIAAIAALRSRIIGASRADPL